MRRHELPPNRALHIGEVAEWSNAPDSKSGLRFHRNVGSNPTLSAISTSCNNNRLLWITIDFCWCHPLG